MSEKTNAYNVPTTGHVWDDNLAELTNPPPKWWMIGLHASWLLVVLYGVFYPSWPMIGAKGFTPGIAGWTQIKEYKGDLQSLDAMRAKYEDQLKDKSAAEILADPQLKEYTTRSANVLFGDNCAACHGSKGAGNPGFPVLADDDWLAGGTVDQIQATVTNGRRGMMPVKGGAALSDAEVATLADAISKGQPLSTPLFTEKGCVACHGTDGKGNQAIGSANLTDNIWRFDGSVEGIAATISHGVNDPSDAATRNAVMPTFGGSKLTATDIKKLSVYVHELGGGK
jgi:cytochrome c oxidase cbb3-type subunit 3